MVIIEVAIRQGLQLTRLWIEVVVDSLQIHFAGYFWQETELQPTASEFLHDAVVILIEYMIVPFRPYTRHVKIDHHV